MFPLPESYINDDSSWIWRENLKSKEGLSTTELRTRGSPKEPSSLPAVNVTWWQRERQSDPYWAHCAPSLLTVLQKFSLPLWAYKDWQGQIHSQDLSALRSPLWCPKTQKALLHHRSWAFPGSSLQNGSGMAKLLFIPQAVSLIVNSSYQLRSHAHSIISKHPTLTCLYDWGIVFVNGQC